ncbi:MAG: HEAT repeat domain-containing protein [Thermoanaerobaculia bacterium]
MRRAAVEDRDPEVRGQGLFWLAQSGDPGAGDWILGRLDAERDPEVREQAVLALSQLDDGVDHLLALLARRDEPELVRRALFWLAQSDDPRAMAEIERLLGGP